MMTDEVVDELEAQEKLSAKVMDAMAVRLKLDAKVRELEAARCQTVAEIGELDEILVGLVLGGEAGWAKGEREVVLVAPEFHGQAVVVAVTEEPEPESGLVAPGDGGIELTEPKASVRVERGVFKGVG